MSTPDWAERAVRRIALKHYYAVRTNWQDCPAEDEPVAMCLSKDVLVWGSKLLRAERKRVVRAIGSLRTRIHKTTPKSRDAKFYRAGAVQSLDDLLRVVNTKMGR